MDGDDEVGPPVTTVEVDEPGAITLVADDGPEVPGLFGGPTTRSSALLSHWDPAKRVMAEATRAATIKAPTFTYQRQRGRASSSIIGQVCRSDPKAQMGRSPRLPRVRSDIVRPAVTGRETRQRSDEKDTRRWRIGPYDDPDRYELLERRSQGGQADLWLGRVTLGRIRFPVAIKVFRTNRRLAAAEIERSGREEVELLRCLDHPNLPRVREFFAGPGRHAPGSADETTRSLCLVMNWIDGTDLAEWVAEDPGPSMVDVLGVLGPVADALDYLHSGRDTQGVEVVHRDVSPDNVIIKGSDVILVDFSLARLAGGRMTFGGKPVYLAPEVLEHGQFGPPSDRFALGVTACFALLGGRLPEERTVDQLRSHLVRRLSPRGRDLSEVVLRALDPDPTRRPRSAVAWIREVRSAADEIRHGPPEEEPPTLELGFRVVAPSVVRPSPAPASPDDVEPRRRRRRRLPLVAIALGLVFGLAAALTVPRLWERQSHPPATALTALPPPGDAVPAGRYRTAVFVPEVAVQLGSGWRVQTELSDLVELVRDADPTQSVQIVRAERVYDDRPFAMTAEARSAVRLVAGLPQADLGAWMESHDALTAARAPAPFVDVPLQQSLDISVSGGYSYEGCPKGDCVLLFNMNPYEGRSEFYPFAKSAGERARVALVRLAGTRSRAATNVVIMASAPPERLDAFVSDLAGVLRITRIGGLK